MDFVERMVAMKSLRITNLVFPNMKSSLTAKYKATVIDALPKKKMLLISLDRVLAGMERS